MTAVLGHAATASPISDSQLLAQIHVVAASVGNVTDVGWVKHVRRVESGRVFVHSVIRIEAASRVDGDKIGRFLFGRTTRVGHWSLNHVGIPDADLRKITVSVEDGPR